MGATLHQQIVWLSGGKQVVNVSKQWTAGRWPSWPRVFTPAVLGVHLASPCSHVLAAPGDARGGCDDSRADIALAKLATLGAPQVADYVGAVLVVDAHLQILHAARPNPVGGCARGPSSCRCLRAALAVELRTCDCSSSAPVAPMAAPR